MLLYIHFPFCRSKCSYCAFCSQPLQEELLNVYVQALVREIYFWGPRLEQPVISNLYIGGGTPSLLPLKSLEKIVFSVKENFRLQSGLEFSLEANPDSVHGRQYLKDVASLGVNRLSLGLQSLDEEILYILKRPHSADQALQAIRSIKSAGFLNFSLDLLWGLPLQTINQWLKQLKTIIEFKPAHISCYGLTPEPGTPLKKSIDSGQFALPDENEQARMYLQGTELLEEQGYLQYEISNFARMGFFCRHNQGYWEGEDYLGLGPAAVSTLNGRRWKNPRDLKKYTQNVEQESLGKSSQKLSAQDRVSELVMLSLRTSRGLRLKDYARLTGFNFCSRYASLIRVLRQNNLIRIRNGYLRLTTNGMLVSNSILAHFLD